MRKILLTTLSLLAPAMLAVSCGKLDEGINVADLHGTVLVPKAVVGTSQLGMVYVGIYSGIDTRLGYPAPKAAPQSSSAGADSFPYGGTSIGTFQTQDYRYVCARVSGRDVVDAGANWELSFSVLQFPFYEGATVWAFLDQNNSTCNNQDGYSFYQQILVGLTDRNPGANPGEFVLGLDPQTVTASDLAAYEAGVSTDRTELLDEAGIFWDVIDVDTNALSVTVVAPLGGGGTPNVNGDEIARLYLGDDGDPDSRDTVDYGSQFNDVLNFPYKYIEPGDIVSGASGVAILNDLSDVTVTVDTVVQ